MSLRVGFLLVFGCSVFRLGEAKLCKPSVVDSIKKIWNSNVPTNLLETAKANGQEVVVATTSGYFSDDVRCTYSIYGDSEADKMAITTVPVTGSAATSEIVVQEEDGATFELNKEVIRYHVVQNEGGVTAFYKCQEAGVEGDPEGLIKVRSSGYQQSSVDKAKEILKGLGINIVKDFPSTCP